MRRKSIVKPGKGVVASKVIASEEIITDNASLVEFLKSKGIDTHMHRYELIAESYDRYESGKVYNRKFKCPGDYLAYFSMKIHRGPSYRTLIADEWIGVYEDEFRAIVDENPTVDDIAREASSYWYGDGDDYIIKLSNLDTGDILYESDYEYEEYEEDDWEE